MSFAILTPAYVEALHDLVLNPGDLQGLAGNKSLEGALARVDNRLLYGMIEDVFDLAAAYAEAVSRGHCFNDGNKRTAYQTMDTCLVLNGILIPWHGVEVADRIIALAQGKIDAADLAAWLRAQAG